MKRHLRRTPAATDGKAVVVALAKRTELGKASALAREGFDQEIAHCFDFDGVQNFRVFISEQVLRQRVADEGSLVWLARDDTGVVGMAELRPKAHVSLLFVADSARKRGVGRALWRHVLAHLAAKACNCDVTVNATPNAVGFYKRLGFHRAGADVHERGLRFTPMAYEVHH